MGVPPEWREFIYRWMTFHATSRARTSAAFFQDLPAERRVRGFDVVLLDGMQELALVKHGATCNSGAAIQERMCDAALAHLVPREGCSEVTAARLLVMCLDNPYTVPRNKAFQEASRDGPRAGDASAAPAADVILTAATLPGVVERAVAERIVTERRRLRPDATRADVERVEREVRATFDPLRHFLVDAGLFPADGSQIWRNSSLSWQLKRVVTEGLVGLPVPAGKFLLIDDGLLVDEARYGELTAAMLRDHGFDDGHRSMFERVSLVGSLMRSCVQRFFVPSTGDVERLDATGIGESDLKIPYYVQRSLPLGLQRRAGEKASYLVKCQDTDVFWALLMHAETLIDPVTGNIDDVDVWLDSQTPSDRAKGLSRPYRFVNVVALWRELLRALHEEFPKLCNPLESLVALVFCNANDYVEAFAPPLKLGPATLWNLFSETLAYAADKPTYLAFAAKRDPVQPDFPRAMRGILDDWVVTSADGADAAACRTPFAHRVLALRPKPALAFFYALCQRGAIVKSLAKQFPLQATGGATTLPFEANHGALLETLAHLSQLAASNLYTKDQTAPLLCVPVVAAMKARIARINWTLDYFKNGWRTTAFERSWFDMDGALSRHGWTISNVTGTADASLSSQYLYAEYQTPPNLTPHYRSFRPRVAFEVAKSVYDTK